MAKPGSTEAEQHEAEGLLKKPLPTVKATP